MFGLKNISIDILSGTPLLVILALAILCALSVYLYFRTNPPLPGYLKVGLGALRVIAVLALILALLEPVLGFTREFERNRNVTVLIDKSSSMSRVESGRSRTARTDSLLSSPAFEFISRNAAITTYFFGGGLSQDQKDINTDRTALGDALGRLATEELAEPSDYWLLLSDGNSNNGIDPMKAAQGLATPVFAVDMSMDQGNFDVGIAGVEFNPVMFVGQPTEIQVRLNWHNAANKNVTISLVDSNATVEQVPFRITQDEGLGDVTISYLPTSPGQKILRVQLPTLENEENGGNNSRSFSVKVLKSRLLVLLVSNEPDYEVGFLKRFLDQTDKYDVELIVPARPSGNLFGAFPSNQSELNRYDLVILHDPIPEDLESRREIIQSYLAERGGALWVMMGERFNGSDSPPWIQDLLPFYRLTAEDLRLSNFHAELSEGHLYHPSIRLADNQTAIRKIWNELPPFQSLVACTQTAPDAVVLAAAGVGNMKLPVLGYRRIGPGKVFASAALPFWTWGFITVGFGEDATSYGKFVEGTCSWLTVSDDLDPIRIVPSKEVYHRGEPIEFKGYAYDLGFRPIPGVSGVLALDQLGTEERHETDLIGTGEGAFAGHFFNIVPGEYRYSGRFEKEGRLLKEVSGKIVVERFSLEEFDQSGNPSTLMAVARLSGGDYIGYSDFDRVAESMTLDPVNVQRTGEIVLWNKSWLLLLFIGALSIEWLVRKAHQLL